MTNELEFIIEWECALENLEPRLLAIDCAFVNSIGERSVVGALLEHLEYELDQQSMSEVRGLSYEISNLVDDVEFECNEVMCNFEPGERYKRAVEYIRQKRESMYVEKEIEMRELIQEETNE